jgi:hypothetical protein
LGFPTGWLSARIKHRHTRASELEKLAPAAACSPPPLCLRNKHNLHVVSCPSPRAIAHQSIRIQNQHSCTPLAASTIRTHQATPQTPMQTARPRIMRASRAAPGPDSAQCPASDGGPLRQRAIVRGAVGRDADRCSSTARTREAGGVACSRLAWETSSALFQPLWTGFVRPLEVQRWVT